jgi:hypothetical protein
LADGTIPEVPTVETILQHGDLMRHTLLRLIRNKARNGYVDAFTRLRQIEWLADAGLSAPLDPAVAFLYESLVRELERVTRVFDRVNGRPGGFDVV